MEDFPINHHSHVATQPCTQKHLARPMEQISLQEPHWADEKRQEKKAPECISGAFDEWVAESEGFEPSVLG